MIDDELLSAYELIQKVNGWINNVRKSTISDEDFEEIFNAVLECYQKIEPYCDKYAETKDSITPENMTIDDFLFDDIDNAKMTEALKATLENIMES